MSFSITCVKCGTAVTSENHKDAFEFMDWARGQGWVVPDILTNQPILCPKDKPNAQP